MNTPASTYLEIAADALDSCADHGRPVREIAERMSKAAKQAKRHEALLAAMLPDLEKLIDYNWDAEADDFEEYDGDEDAHIFTSIKNLAMWYQTAKRTI